MLKSIVGELKGILSKTQKVRILIITSMMIVSAALETVGVSLVIPIISIVMNPEGLMNNDIVIKICRFLNLTEPRQVLMLFLLFMIFIYVFKNAYAFLLNYVQSRFVYNNQCMTQAKILDKYLCKPYEDFLYINTAEALRLITSDVSNVFESLSGLMSMISELIISGFLIITIFVINPFMTMIIACVFGGTILLTSKVLRKKLERIGRSIQKENDGMNKWVLQSLEGIKEIKISHTEKFFLYRYMHFGKDYCKDKKGYAVLACLPRLLTETIFFGGLLTVILCLVAKGQDMTSLFTQLSAFAVAAIRIMPSANRLNGYISSLAYMKPSIDRISEVFTEKEDDRYREDVEDNSLSVITLNDKIELKDISYRYPKTDKFIFEHANLSVKAGQLVGIVGSSGAGKTTIVDILMGLLSAERGKILSDGKDINGGYANWLAMIGYISQNIYLMDDTIKANVALGTEASAIEDEQVWRALEEAQIADHVRGLPEGINTFIGERGVRLSGGQRQRLGIARALYRNPQILIFDEATSALDNETEAAIMESIEMLYGKKTMIIIAHRLSTIQHCDVVYRVENGKIEIARDIK